MPGALTWDPVTPGGAITNDARTGTPNYGAPFTVIESTPYVQMTATGTALSGEGEFAGIEVVSGSGTITIYDNTSAAGSIVFPATAVSVGKQERTWKLQLQLGCHVVISGTMTVNILVG